MPALDKFKKTLSEKQFNVLSKWVIEKPRITMLSGGK